MSKEYCHAIDKQVGQNIRLFRIAAGLLQEEVGEHLGITFQQIQKYEKGLNRITAGKLVAMAELFGREVIEFFDTKSLPANCTTRMSVQLVKEFRELDHVQRKAVLAMIRGMRK